LNEKQNNLRSFSTRWRVRSYELDSYGHVNNAVYLGYAEEVAVLHAEALGFGREWTLARGGAWLVRRHEIIYRRPAQFGDQLELTTTVVGMRGARAVRQTAIALADDGTLLAEVSTEWVWTRASDGRPTRIPTELVAAFGEDH
jgi:acyl-CoA thioester hydrolase